MTKVPFQSLDSPINPINPSVPLLDFGYMASNTTSEPNRPWAKPILQESANSSDGSVVAYGFLGLFAFLLAAMKFKHEMYLDEGQAWVIARDSTGLFDLIHHLHYEGHPVLWYLVLYLPAHFAPHFMISMQYIHYAIALGTAWLVLTERRLPMVIRVLLVFGISLFFSMGILARSYMLAGLLLIGAARCLQAERPRHWLGVGLLVLAINTHFFAIPVAISIFVWCYWLSSLSAAGALALCRERRFWISVCLLGCALGICFLTVRPAPDVSTPNYELVNANSVDYLVLGIGKVWSYFIPFNLDLLSASSQNLAVPLTRAAIVNACLTFSLWLLALAVLPGSKGRWFMVTASLLWTVEVWATVHIPLLSHSSILVVIYAISLTLTSDGSSRQSWLPSDYAQPLMLVLLSLQVSTCVFFCYQEWVSPFSGGEATSKFLERTRLLNRRLVIQPQMAGPAILGYTGVNSAYYPSCRCDGSFAVYRKGQEIFRQVTLEEIQALRRSSGMAPVVISGVKIDEGDVTSLGLHLVYTAPKSWAVYTEDVFVYEASSTSALNVPETNR